MGVFRAGKTFFFATGKSLRLRCPRNKWFMSGCRALQVHARAPPLTVESGPGKSVAVRELKKKDPGKIPLIESGQH